MRMRTLIPVLAAAVALAGVMAGCGSSRKGPEVATANGAGAASASPTPSANADRDEQLRQFAQCMRDHGVNMQDPQPGAGPGGGLASGINPNDPAVQSAFTACQSKLPNGGQLPKLNTQQLEQYRVFAQCMRDNAIDLPDPEPDGTLPVGQLIRFVNDPTFAKALQACRDKLTGLLPSASAR
jgi:hypothetical protein